MGPAQRTVPALDPEIFYTRFADVRHVGGRGRLQAGPEVGYAAFTFEPRVNYARQRVANPSRRQRAAGPNQRHGERQVITTDVNHVGHAQLIAQAAGGAFGLVVNQADPWRRFWFE